ncbi:hypothetical protein FHX74_001456 [Friedmanniella endophytica]|uniref:DUF2510 domain-containing protein n=1 Tax=Microlunatus kandeliicorticis TaxID=1759536 RepID=A0A7W3IRD9_9ACTN|nr:DUF2510 domain-containing protein [Microlunatus kandeliicorticis]MBA8793851.1 hypothetical protein [Microlunatus kandeliicorticis]
MTEPADGAPPPGWFPDPAGRPDTYRWWDGTTWTPWLTGDADADAPDTTTAEPETPHAEPVEAQEMTSAEPVEAQGSTRAEPEMTPAEPVEAQGRTRAEPVEAPPGPAPLGRPRPPGYERGRRSSALATPPATRLAPPSGASGGGGHESAGAGADHEGGSSRTALRVMAAAAAVAAVVVVGGVVVLGNRAPADPIALPPMTETGSSPSGSASGTAAASPATYDARSRLLSIGTFSTTLPGSPYVTSSALAPTPPLFSTAVEAQAVVTPKYDGSADWTAGLLVGVLDPSVVVDGDADATADKLLDGLAEFAFADVTVTKQGFTPKKVTTPNAKAAAILQGRLAYRVKNVPSRYDQVSMLVLELDDGTWVGWVSTRPEKASAKVKASLQTSIDTIRS